MRVNLTTINYLSRVRVIKLNQMNPFIDINNKIYHRFTGKMKISKEIAISIRHKDLSVLDMPANDERGAVLNEHTI